MKRRLTPEERAEIAKRFADGDDNLYAMAKEYGVSRGTIFFIVHPDKAVLNAQRNLERNRRNRARKTT